MVPNPAKPGKWIPLDARPINNFVYVEVDGEFYPYCWTETDKKRYISHFMTCPEAASFSGKGKG